MNAYKTFRCAKTLLDSRQLVVVELSQTKGERDSVGRLPDFSEC